MMNQNDPNNWKTAEFRQNVIIKLETVQKRSGLINSNCSELENQIFKKATNRKEYLTYISQLFARFGEGAPAGAMISQQGPSHQGVSQQAISQQNMSHHGMTQQGMSQQAMHPPTMLQQSMNQQGGPSNVNTATNLLQSLNQGRANIQNRMPMQVGPLNSVGPSLSPMQQAGIQQGSMQSGMIHGTPMNQINVVMGNQMNPNVNPSLANVISGPGSVMNVNSLNSQIVNSTSMSGQMPNSMTGPMPVQVGGVMNSQMGGQVPSQMGNAMMHNQMNVHLAAQQRKMIPEGMMMSGLGSVPYMQPRGPVPAQFIRQNAPTVTQSMMQVNTMSNMIPPPTLFPSTSPTQVNNANIVAPVMRTAGPNMTPSPSNSTSLNTPGGQSQPTPSPLSNEEQAYREKVKQLSRYIEPLRRVISRSGSGDNEKMSKMKKLLEILSSPGQRIAMDALLKCEAVLEKMDLKGLADVKEQHPLIDAISTAIQSPNANHTFQRTFDLVMTTLNGKPLRTLPKPLKRKHVEEVPSEIPEALQGEVARLDQRFKVSLDPVQQTSPKCVYLLCWLDDRNLPCIPPVQIAIPEDYPNSSPKCNLSNYEYGATKFLQMIQKALQARISKLSSKYTMSQLLDTWENSVRETCSSDRINSISSVF